MATAIPARKAPRPMAVVGGEKPRFCGGKAASTRPQCDGTHQTL